MRALRGLHGCDTASVGNFFTEVCTARESRFWLSPAHGGNKIRLDVNWFQYNSVDGHALPPFRLADPVPFFSKYWQALDAARIPYTTHLRKYRPRSHATRPRLRQDYERYDDWLDVRKMMDPGQAFLIVVDAPPVGTSDTNGTLHRGASGMLHRIRRHLRHVSEVAADAIRGRARVPEQVARLQEEGREEKRRAHPVDLSCKKRK